MTIAKKFDWLDGDQIRPYVYVRPENEIESPGTFAQCDWFPFAPIKKNPLKVSEVDFANQILNLEASAFHSSQMAMPRWVFFDCAIMPGIVTGFATRTKNLNQKMIDLLKPDPKSEWSPLSLFIIIPTSGKEWVAHNLCSINSELDPVDQFYGLGFLSKAFGLWYANIEVCCGMTQWNGHALKLHSHYGALEVLTSYTPVHSFPETLTYRLKVDSDYWNCFFNKKPSDHFHATYKPTSLQVEPLNVLSLQKLQGLIEQGEGPFFLDGDEIRKNGKPSLTVYQSK